MPRLPVAPPFTAAETDRWYCASAACTGLANFCRGIWGSAWSPVISRSTFAAYAGSRRVWPWGAATTTVTVAWS